MLVLVTYDRDGYRGLGGLAMTDKLPEPFWKVPDPRGLLGQTRAVALMRSDKRASYKHFALIEFHWGWAHKDYDWTSLASVRRMHAELAARDPVGGTPISLPHINRGNRDLCEWGWLFEIEKGSGRTASRFMPNFTLFNLAERGDFSKFLSGEVSFSVNPLGIRRGFEISVHPIGNARVTYEVNTNAFSVHPLGNKDLLTGTVLKDGPTESRIDPAPPSAPPPVGLEATGADRAGEGFEQLWKAYGYRHKKADAKAAYMKLAPDTERHAAMIAAASEWHASWAAQGKEDAPRFTLAKWIEREEFECDPPTAYRPKERKAKPQKTALEPANDNAQEVDEGIPDFMRGSPRLWPVGDYLGEFIEGSVVQENEWDTAVELLFKAGPPHGKTMTHKFFVKCSMKSEEDAGLKYLDDIYRALSLRSAEDADELLYRPIRVRADGSKLTYSKVEEVAA